MQKSIKTLCLAFLVLPLNSWAITYHPNPEQRSKALEAMDAFCKKANGTVATFENSCGNSCIIYNRKTGKKLPGILKNCQKQKIISCQCGPEECFKDQECQDIIL